MQLEDKNDADIRMYQNEIARLKEANQDYALEILKQDHIVSRLEQNQLQVSGNSNMDSLLHCIDPDSKSSYSMNEASKERL